MIPATIGMGTRVAGGLHFSDKSLVGVSRLLEDLQHLLEDKDSADIIFVIGREETHIAAHKLILKARCKSFVEASGGEVCVIPGSTVTPGSPQTTIRLPQYQPVIFRQVINYIYTGKVVMSDSGVFEVHGVAHDLGLEELCQHCEDHIATTMTPHNACTFLMAALKMEQRTGGSKGSRSFVDRCVAYIGENALECMQTSSFLNLSREALIRLISSDNLALEEEDVWRGVLNWAKYGAGVAQPTAHWTEEERLRVCQQLQGVINHVRLLLIDSQVFAEEVEPTGAVPMELSLERYRYAALPNKFKDNSTNEDKRLQPRVSLKLFAGSQILINEKMSLQRVLNSWYGANKQMWRLVYRASTHGYSADAFHRHCDGVAPTYTIVMGQHGEICGGFSDVPWGKTTMKGRYVASDKAFLFTLVNNQDIPPTKFPVIKKMFAICYHPDCGPIFGAGADLFIAGNCNQNLESYSNLPHSYDGENASCNTLMSDYNFTVLDYEVFSPYGK
ncbi:BTB/POZ domain-containing protein 9-like isoform X3 [Eriocheir sinensis]|uniref:BTB/POZ domain-containing protein 9-like isoform X3 n=1 Tax=Eriocheir sinensis TaxID=95602 RepID=UPI0021C69FD4|nr:BTB/POZ domain-containing protein 9-like isoform X3 [Eriocheir sinensis]